MGLMRTVSLAVVTSVVMGHFSVGLAQGTDKPPRPPVEDPDATWRERLQLPGDSFLMYGIGRNEPAWVKFTIVPQTDGSQKVYFQDGHEYPFHYQFAVKHLESIAGIWRIDNLQNPRTYRLHTENIPALVSMAESPILTLRDFRYLTLEVEYERPVLQWNWEEPVMTTRDQVRLVHVRFGMTEPEITTYGYQEGP